ncbi:hypothetical protein COCOBI_09-5920 [Coccomyxa sp. Obi]|nr:hypothetical protein COCOBI_09-5920 [Coccomyxa sp. Obi]
MGVINSPVSDRGALVNVTPRRPIGWSRRSVCTYALFSRKQKQAAQSKVADTPPKQSFLSGVVEALDFAEARSANDAKLIYQAKQKKKGERLTPEEARALRRKVGGTASNYFKEWVDVQGKYAEKGYVSSQSSSLPPGFAFLLLVVVGMVGALGYVVSQTS